MVLVSHIRPSIGCEHEEVSFCLCPRSKLQIICYFITSAIIERHSDAVSIKLEREATTAFLEMTNIENRPVGDYLRDLGVFEVSDVDMAKI